MGKNGFIVVADDQREHADGLAESLVKHGEEAIAAYSAAEALAIVRSQRIDLVVTEMHCGTDIDGIEILEEIRRTTPHTEVIIVTSNPTIETCKKALRQGAFDYLVKPVATDEFLEIVRRAMEKARSSYAGASRPARVEKRGFAFEGIPSVNPVMQAVYQVLRRVSATTINVLVEGESG
ncbi:MAG TPA: response regulator, partial [Sedimentisphaerales bacterium]|nr:response regulator [Sedimentisphaerales bacterium]